ncbi:hypothetical protein D9M71_318310 [compost metagenome]
MVAANGQRGHGQAEAEVIEKNMSQRIVANLAQVFEADFHILTHAFNDRLQQLDLQRLPGRRLVHH